VLYGSRPPPKDSPWRAAKAQGFEVIVYDRSAANREKRVDTTMAADIVAYSYQRMNPERDEVTLVAGDKDYVPVAERLITGGFRFPVVFWSQPPRN
jgi:uncharacterized LabA/DUF88 family protein